MRQFRCRQASRILQSLQKGYVYEDPRQAAVPLQAGQPDPADLQKGYVYEDLRQAAVPLQKGSRLLNT